MEYWKYKNLDIGTVTERSSTEVIFQMTEHTPKITDLSSSCGCSTPKIYGDKIVVNFKAERVPKHLKEQGYYTTRKYIYLAYADGSGEQLSFKAKVKI